MPNVGWRPTDEMRAKMRAAKLGKPGPWTGKKRGPMSDEQRAKIGAGNTGKVRSLETRQKIRAAFVGKPRSPETIAKMRTAIDRPEARAKMRASVFGKPLRHAKHEFIYHGQRFKSSFEVRVAAALDALGVCWLYEPTRFYFNGFTYAPDFFLVDDGSFIEVKGWYGPDSIAKVERFRADYPHIPLVLMCEPAIEMLERAAMYKAA